MFHLRCEPKRPLNIQFLSRENGYELTNGRYALRFFSSNVAWSLRGLVIKALKQEDQEEFLFPIDASGLYVKVRCAPRFSKEEPWKKIGGNGPFFLKIRSRDICIRLENFLYDLCLRGASW